MSDEGTWPPTVSPQRARRGAVVRLVLTGEGVEAATGVAIEGAGVVVRRAAEAERGRLEMLISIAIDASPGWRDIEVAFGDRRRRLARAFEVLDAASYGAGGRGIGSHLI